MSKEENLFIEKFVKDHKLIKDFRFLDIFKKAPVISTNRRISSPKFVLEICNDDQLFMLQRMIETEITSYEKTF